MKINVELSPKSIQEAIEKLKKVKYQVTKGTIIKELLECICEWLINRANWYLDNADIGENVKIDIRNGWEYDVSLDGAKIINRTEKAVFVEFGVGEVGQLLYHENAIQSKYEYNIPTEAKSPNGQWMFRLNDTDEIDLEYGMYKIIPNKYGDFWVLTKGSPAVMYAYNAIVDAQNELKNPNGVFAQEYKKLLERYVR